MSVNKKSDLTTLKRVIKLAKPHRLSFWVSIFLSLALAGINAVQPIFVKRTIDLAIDNYEYNKVFLLALSVFGLILLAAVLRYFFIYITRFLGQAVVKDLRVKMFKHVIGLRLSFFDKTPIGTATTRTVNDIETVNNIFTQGLIQIVADLAAIIFILIIMFYNNPIMGLMSISTLPILIYVSYIFKNKVKVTFQKVRTKVSELNAFLQEHITGMKIVQIFGVEKQEFDKYEKINQAHTNANVATIWYYSLFFPAVEILQSIAISFMIWMGANYIVGGNLNISVGLMVSYILWINMLFRPIRFLAERFNTVQMGLVAAERVFNLIDNSYTIENKGTIKDVEIKGDIEFKNVSFSYTTDKEILKNLNFSIKKGETVAIVGSTGSGKSTIINVLSKLYPIKKGEITIDGRSIDDYDLGFLRSQICTVLQDVFLFSGTIADNIRLLNKDITIEEIKNTAELIGANDFIEKLPNSYDYQVMERGATLSLGQRQLISFARALIYKPAILVLDEATSSVDTETENIVQNAIDKMIVNRTSIIIAHRLSTIENADKIMVLKDGIIIEYGTREELLSKREHFFELYQNQFNKKII
tara:strand:+ start:4895 stop:6652 length:1758 start_codon:yes stop_codon:yes gene_type:complete